MAKKLTIKKRNKLKVIKLVRKQYKSQMQKTLVNYSYDKSKGLSIILGGKPSEAFFWYNLNCVLNYVHEIAI